MTGPRSEDSGADDAAARDAMSEALTQAARRSAVGRVIPGQEPTGAALWAAVGGVRGIVESILPGLLFLVLFTVTGEVAVSVLAPVVIAVIFIGIRLVRREPLGSAIAGAFGIALSAGIALFTGEARDNFVVGFFINGGITLAMVVSLVARWPFIGAIVGFAVGDREWRADKAKFRVAVVATLIWATFPLVRLAVELPLYFTDQTSALATAKLLLGVPLYAIVLWITWLLVRSVWSFGMSPSDSSEETR
ncbi:MAG: hypothetical protein CMF56_06215 [Leifsonia sp.]|nr:hypothetical protein [Leifsonia sp.]|tara:strand:- start:198107 stop:198853 length:747 start_codon:yes stop_codon:yes gene_type:complete